MKHANTILLCLVYLFTLIPIGCIREPDDKNAPTSISGLQNTIRGGVQCVYLPDNSVKSYFDVEFGEDFKGSLPDDIDSITVDGPERSFKLGMQDFSFYPKSSVFWAMIPGEPQLGSYTFTVKSGDAQFSVADVQSENKKLLLANPNTYLPAEGAILRPNETKFSWEGGIFFKVRNNSPTFYQLQIGEPNKGRIYTSGFVKNMFSHNLPEGVLKPDREYDYRVRVSDSDNWVKAQNRSNSRWIRFKTAKSLEYQYRIPEKINDGWAVSSLSNGKIDSDKIDLLMEDLIHKRLKNVHSVLLVRNGKLVFEEYLRGYTRERKHLIASVTKSITSILIGIAIDQKTIGSVNQKVYAFFPDHKGSRWIDQKYDISLKHVLNMTAGTDWDEITYLHPHPKNSNTGLYSAAHPIDHILNHNVILAPGKTWNYSSGLTVLLGGIIKNTTGLYADKFAEKTLFHPLGISDYYWYRHSDGTVFTNGDLLLTPRDMAKIGYLMLNAGKWKGKQIVSENWIKESTSGTIKTGSGYQYGYQWRAGTVSISGQEVEGYWASGTGGQKIYVFPKLDLVAVMTSQVFGNMSGHDRNQWMLVNYILPSVLPPAPPRKVIPLASETIDSYTGKYKISEAMGKIPLIVRNLVIFIIRKGNDLFIKMPDGKTVKLFPLSQDHFFFSLQGVEYQGKVIRNEEGNVKSVVRKIGFRSLTLDKIE